VISHPEKVLFPTLHVWGSRVPKLLNPDVCVFDLDPSTDDPDAVRAAALGLRDLLDKLGLPSWLQRDLCGRVFGSSESRRAGRWPSPSIN
jgi:hypothetical protein